MKNPTLQVRAKAQSYITEFGGYDHRPVIREGNWYDEQNLASDQYPLMTVRRNRERVQAVDGNIVDTIVSVAGKEHLVLLTADGEIRVNGQSLALLDYTDHVYVTPAARAVLDDLDEAVDYFGPGMHTMVYDRRVPEGNTEPLLGWWLPDGTWTVNLPAAGIAYQTGYSPAVGDTITVEVARAISPGSDTPRQMVSMGAYVVIIPDNKFVNVVKLEDTDGSSMVAGTDYGDLGNKVVTQFDPMGRGDEIRLTLCDSTGTAYTGVVEGDTEPATQSGYWLDTRGSMQLYEWSASSSAWVAIPTTYVKIEATDTTKVGSGFRQGDGIQMTASPVTGSLKGAGAMLNRADVIRAIAEDGSWIVVAGICQSGTINTELTLERKIPALDYVVECGNRLWGCHYGKDESGEVVNEIYACKLGDFRNWYTFEGISTDSYVASLGSDGPYTGAAVLSGSPLFFKENSLEKVFPSTTGAHQIVTHNLDGVQAGCWRSLVVIDERLYYKAVAGVMRYTGSLPVLISQAFGNEAYSSAVAGRHGKKYYITMQGASGRVLMCYDTMTGVWHKEDCPFADGEIASVMADWDGALYYTVDGALWRIGTGTDSKGVRWYAQSGELGLELTETKWPGRARLRYRLDYGAEVKLYVAHDNGPWMLKGRLFGNRLRSETFVIHPRRCDHFRIRLEGVGGFTLYSLSYEREKGGDV